MDAARMGCSAQTDSARTQRDWDDPNQHGCLMRTRRVHIPQISGKIISLLRCCNPINQQGLKGGERGRNRTFNLLIKSQLLCQLSYAPSP